jgi:hypothetical protein
MAFLGCTTCNADPEPGLLVLQGEVRPGTNLLREVDIVSSS